MKDKINNKKPNKQKSELDSLKGNSTKFFIKIILFLVILTSFTLLFILLPVLGIREISIFGIMILDEDLYIGLVNSIITQEEFSAFISGSDEFSLFIIIIIFIGIGYSFYKFLFMLFKAPNSSLDFDQTDGKIKWSKPNKIMDRVLVSFVPSESFNEIVIERFIGSIYKFISHFASNERNNILIEQSSEVVTQYLRQRLEKLLKFFLFSHF